MEINLLSADIIFRKYAEDEYQSKNKKKPAKIFCWPQLLIINYNNCLNANS